MHASPSESEASEVAPPSALHEFGHRLWTTLRALTLRFADDERELAAAGLAFYILLSIAPLLVVAIQVAAAIFDRAWVRQTLVEDLGRATGQQVTELLDGLMRVQQENQSSAATVLSSVLLILAASRLFHRLQAALNVTWGVKDVPLQTGPAIWRMLRKRLISYLMVIASGLALIVSLVLKAAIALVQVPMRHFVPIDALPSHIAQLGENVTSLALLTALLAGMYRFLPDVLIEWRDVWVGAGLTSILLVVGMGLFSVYVATVGASQLAGAIGSIAVLMLWAYYTSQVLLLGALFTRLWADGPEPKPHRNSLLPT